MSRLLLTDPVQRPAPDEAAARRSRIAQEIADEINAPLRAMTAHERAMYPLLRELMRLRHRACDVQADHDDDYADRAEWKARR